MTVTLKAVSSAGWRTIGILFGAGAMSLSTSLVIGALVIELLPIASGIVCSVILISFVLVVRSEKSSRFYPAFTMRPIPPDLRSHILFATAAVMVLAPCLVVVNRRIFPNQVHPPDPINDLLGQPLGWIPFIFASVIFAPLVEELIDRGWLLRKLEIYWGGAAAIALSSLFFGLSHFVLWMTPYFALVGAILGYAVYTTRSVWTGVVLHAGFNTSLLVFGFLISEEVFETWLHPAGTGIVIAPLGIAFAGGALIYLDRSRRALTAPEAPSPPASASVLA